MKLVINLFLAFLIFLSFIPFNYFFESNFNAIPIQILIIVLLSRLFFTLKYDFMNILFVISTFVVLILISNIQFNDLFSTSITASFITLWSIIYSKKLKFKIKNFNAIINSLLFIIITFTLYFNIDFFLNIGFIIRSKGFGSGTIYSLISLYGFTYILLQSKIISMSKTYFYLALFIFFSTALLTQSRGVILTMFFVYIVSEISNIKLSRLLLISATGIYFLVNSTILERFRVDDYSELNILSSGRYDTQVYIINNYIFESDAYVRFFGNGLNSLKKLYIDKGFEYPHLDLLYLLHEGGFILVSLYLITLFKLYKTHNSKLLFWIYVISSFHTNMVISPGFLFFGILLDYSLTQKKENYEKKNLRFLQ